MPAGGRNPALEMDIMSDYWPINGFSDRALIQLPKISNEPGGWRPSFGFPILPAGIQKPVTRRIKFNYSGNWAQLSPWKS